MNTQKLIERVKAQLGVNTDYAAAKELEIPTQRMSDYSHNKRAPDNYAIAKFAKVLKVDPWTLVKEIEAQTEKNQKKKDFWNKAAGIFFFGVILNMSPTPSQAAPMLQVTDLTLYIM